MKKSIIINETINILKKKEIHVAGDKSLSIRFVLLSSLCGGKCTATNILVSEDVLSIIKSIKKLGVKINLKGTNCEVFGKGLFGYNYKKNLVLDAGNSGTTARLLCATLIDSNYKIKIVGDNSLRKRDMSRIIKPLEMFGASFEHSNGKLPLFIKGSKDLKAIKFTENLGSAQRKSAVMIAALKTPGVTKMKCLPSRNHTELIFKNVLKIPIKIKKNRNYDFIEVKGMKEFKPYRYKIPGDISSASFFIVLTLLTKNSALTIKNVNINPSRTGIIKVLNMMGAKIKFTNIKNLYGEKIADLKIVSKKILNGINLSPRLNSAAIDEFLLIFLVAAVSKGVSTFKRLSELNKKESKRLDWGIKILKMMGIKTKKIKDDGIKIWGNPDLTLRKNYVIKNYLKDHRIFMVSVIASLTLGGKWKIHNPESFKTSFPSFLNILKTLGAKIR